MIQNNYFTDNADLMLYFNELVEWDEIVRAYEGDDFADAQKYKETGDEHLAFAPSSVDEAVEFYRATLESLGELTGNEVAQRARSMDQTGLKYDAGRVIFPEDSLTLFQMFRDAGLIPYNIKRQYGGLGMPASVNGIYNEILTRGDTAFTMTLALLNLAKIVVRYGTEEQKQSFVTRMAAGEFTGAMALTEPNYGSDLSNVRTKAVKQSDGTYRLSGTKRFISQGCGIGETPCILLTLARTGTPTSGARGLSLFIVKSTDVQIAGIEHKMGIHASPTCEVVFEDSPAEIVGEEGFGLTRYSMGMMNDARVTVAALGVGIGNAAYFEGLKYATEREQFGKTIDQIPAVKRMLDHMRREIFAMRLLTGEAARAVDLYLHRQMRMEKSGMAERDIRKDEDIRHWDKTASLFTPLSKYYCSETGVTLASEGMQIHGGSGYTEEYDVARIYRDSRINTVYEGTTQLQVVAAIGGITAGMSANGFFRKYINDELARFSASDGLKELLAMLEHAITTYRSIEDGAVRDGNAFEVVEVATRFLCCLLFERALDRASEASRAQIRPLYRQYMIDSVAIAQADTYRLKMAATAEEPAAV